MARYLIRDLKKVNKPEILNLKNSEAKSAEPKKIPKHLLRLKELQNRNAVFTGQRKHRAIDGLISLKTKSSFHFVPLAKDPAKRGARFFAGFKFAITGLLIVTLLNFFNIFQNGLALKSTLIGNASSGFEGLLDGAHQAKDQNFDQAQTSFTAAKSNFDQARQKISLLNTENSLAATGALQSVNHLLAAGDHISKAGDLFTKSAPKLINWPTLFIQANHDFFTKKEAGSISENRGPSLTDELKGDLVNVQQAIVELQNARNELSQVSPNDLPAKYKNYLPQINTQLGQLTDFLTSLSDHFPAVLSLLGDRYPNRYLILLQNDTEARPTGGFIGSLLILDLNDGYITKADFDDVYKYDGQLHENIPAPEDIAQITDNWRLRDSNYSPDFAISAEKAAWFLQKSKGPSVDTVIAVNQSIVADLLTEFGPLDVTPLKSKITAENFQFIMSYLIETKYFGADNPKKILEKVLQSFQNKLFEEGNFPKFLKLILQAVKNRKVMFYSRDPEVQKFFDYLNLTPHQNTINTQEDYLQVVATSIGGNKSDLYMTENLNHQTYISSDGTVTDELTITRKHNWTGAELARWQNTLKDFGLEGMGEGMKDLLGRGVNKASVKVYLPLGAELKNTVGINYGDVVTRSDIDLKKTYLLFPMSVAPGEEKSITLRYELPFKLDLLPADIYRFQAQSQIGLVQTQIRHTTNLNPPLTQLNVSATLNYAPLAVQQATAEGALKSELRYEAVIAN